MSKVCRRCGAIHNERTKHCEACLVITGGNHHYRSAPVQSQAESNWQDHIDDYRHSDDWINEGHGSQ